MTRRRAAATAPRASQRTARLQVGTFTQELHRTTKQAGSALPRSLWRGTGSAYSPARNRNGRCATRGFGATGPANADPRPARSGRQSLHGSASTRSIEERGAVDAGLFSRVGELVHPQWQMRTQSAFLDMPYVTYSAFEGIQLRQSVESRGSSKEPHGLSAPWATRRRGCGSGGAFVAHEPNSILEPQP